MPTHSYPGFDTSRTLLLAQLLKLPNSLITHILESLTWLKVNERIEYEILSLTYIQDSLLLNLLISKT